jgi:hypothetical protein
MVVFAFSNCIYPSLDDTFGSTAKEIDCINAFILERVCRWLVANERFAKTLHQSLEGYSSVGRDGSLWCIDGVYVKVICNLHLQIDMNINNSECRKNNQILVLGCLWQHEFEILSTGIPQSLDTKKLDKIS